MIMLSGNSKTQQKGPTFPEVYPNGEWQIVRQYIFGSNVSVSGMSMACHPFTQVTTRKDGIDIQRSTEYKVTDASS
jgi:hypothetical protein